MIPLLIRPMNPGERPLVLSAWKRDLADASWRDWGAGLQPPEWWALVNHVVDRISLPTATVMMACHEDEPEVPLAWMAVRSLAILHQHARASVHDEPHLAARLYQELATRTGALPHRWNPFLEMKDFGHMAGKE